MKTVYDSKIVRVLRVYWHVYAAPAKSDAAKVLKVVLPLEIVALAYRMLAPEEWPTLSGVTLLQVLMWYLMLWFVRERDEARTQSVRRSEAARRP